VLEIRDLSSGYGETQVIHGLNFRAAAGRVHAILGRNGVGKTTTLRTIMSLVPATLGSILLDGQEISGRRPYEIARLGVAFVPETRDIFASLTVRENLQLAARLKPLGEPRWTIERVIDFFPRLGERLDNGGNQLSGGEQQMLAIGRALLTNPRLLILDEPTEGLAPIIIRQIHDKLVGLKSEGLTMILVEQNFSFATSLADDVSIISRGKVVWHGEREGIRGNRQLQKQWLGV
jgi:branched-chain amino acid transport system ATP-binding protein